jgi:molybdopterin synthase catalytic subunit
MKVRIVAFATASDALGSSEVELEVPEGSRVEDLQRILEEAHPELAPLWPRLAIAVGEEIARPSTELADGDEVALLPPVSGGRPAEALDTAERAAPLAELTDAPIDVARVTGAVSGPTRGAVLLFLGTVRDSHRGRRVEHLDYSAYRSMAEARLRRIVTDLETSADDLRVAIVHRLGHVPASEPSVAIACASPHRAAAYDASRTALERLKKEVPIWKKEHYAEGDAVWREEERLDT